MTAKEYLCKYLSTERRIRAKEEKVNELKNRCVSLQINMGSSVQSSKIIDGTQRIIEQYIDLENEIAEQIYKLKMILKSIYSTVKKLKSDDQIEVLERRYINGESFTVIAKKMNVCERQIYRIHGKALEEIEKEIN